MSDLQKSKIIAASFSQRKSYNQKYKQEFTDDASVFEAIGGKIITIEGEIKNIKITYPIDLNLAESLIDS